MAGTGSSCSSSTELTAYGTNVQSLAIKVNGLVTPSRTSRSFSDVTARPGAVGLLGNDFDQAAQADLGDESQAGASPASAPVAPSALGSSVASSLFTPAQITTIAGVTFTSSTETYTFANELVVSGNLTLRSGTRSSQFPTGSTFTSSPCT